MGKILARGSLITALSLVLVAFQNCSAPSSSTGEQDALSTPFSAEFPAESLSKLDFEAVAFTPKRVEVQFNHDTQTLDLSISTYTNRVWQMSCQSTLGTNEYRGLIQLLNSVDIVRLPPNSVIAMALSNQLHVLKTDGSLTSLSFRYGYVLIENGQQLEQHLLNLACP